MSEEFGYSRRRRRRRSSEPPLFAPKQTTVPIQANSSQISIHGISTSSRHVEVFGSPTKRPKVLPRTQDPLYGEDVPPITSFSHEPTHDPVYPDLELPGAQDQPEQDIVESDDDEEHVDHVNAGGGHRAKRKSALLQWILDQDEQNLFLTEFLRLKGRGDPEYSRTCADCPATTPVYRCQDCIGPELFCKSCLKWNGDHFERTTLRALGLCVQLCHHPSKQGCSNPVPPPWGSFAIIDINGIHEVDLRFCGCQAAPPGGHVQQLLRWSLLPSTSKNPCTAATFRSLKLHQLMAFEGKVSMFAFYYTLARFTDNSLASLSKFQEYSDSSTTGTSSHNESGPDQPNPADVKAVELDLYASFRRMIRKYQYIKISMRCGRGNDKTGVKGTQPGELALRCPACPHPLINLPPNWQDVPPELRWIYKLFLGIDGNFRMVADDVSSFVLDPALMNGKAYTVQEEGFKKYLDSFSDDETNESSCVSHKAVRDANAKSKESGLRATGMGSVDCARHEMKRPLASGDFQRGERYRNVDYFFWSSIRGYPTGTRFCVSYDIACQWSVNLLKRFYDSMPEDLQMSLEGFFFEFLVPKFHLAAHIDRCRLLYSFFFTEYTGRTDGEAPERLWRYLDAIASMLRGMGPGGRVDRLNDFIGDWNWKKILTMGETLSRKIRTAIPEAQKHVEYLEKYEDVMRPDDIAEWKKMMKDWQADKTRPNPFESKAKPISEQSIRLQLLKDEEAAIGQGNSILVHKDVGPVAVISAGIDISVAQLRLKRDIGDLKRNATLAQQTDVTKESIALRKKFKNWAEYYALHCPVSAVLRSETEAERPEGSKPIPIEDVKLCLPSSLESALHCPQHLQVIEWKIRYARLSDSLQKVRTLIAFETALEKHKYRFSRGQRENLRSNDSIHLAKSRIEFQRLLYNSDREALIKLGRMLGMDANWQKQFRCLEKLDCKPMSPDMAAQDGPVRNQHSEGRYTASWIWAVRGVADNAGSDEDARESLRIEWCKLRMRAHGWACEVKLLLEEMRRVECSYLHNVKEWQERAQGWPEQTDEEREGVVAYAKSQVSMWIRFARDAKTILDRSIRLAAEEGRDVDESRPAGTCL